MPGPPIRDPLAIAKLPAASAPAAATAAMPKAPPQPSLIRLDCLKAQMRLLVKRQAETQAQLQRMTMLVQSLVPRMGAIETLLETQTQAQLPRGNVDHHHLHSGDKYGAAEG